MARYEFFDDGAPDSWAEFLAEFETVLLPVFTKMGYSRDAALIAFHCNMVANKVSRLLHDDPDDDAPWRKEA
jgi:hypothetical protein